MVLYLLATGEGVIELLPILGLFGFAALRLLPAMQTIFSATAAMRFSLAALENLHKELVLQSSVQGQAESVVSPLPFKEELRMTEVCAQYPSSAEPALKSVSLCIQAGTWVALVGPTGAGKSTLADVLMGLLPAKSGEIQVDDEVLLDSNMRKWQANIGYVPQRIFLADDTILGNIAFGVATSEADRAQALEAATQAQLHDFITSLPDGYDSRVGEHGVRLSGGQRQRLGIARALYRNPDVLVLDEATSALDTVTEMRFFETLNALREKKTIVTIAHRMSTTRACDKIFVLERGELVAEGNFQTLQESSDTFRELVTAS